ncbi:hypothetical protein B0T13DRAFT_121341 [Neurospora crassa]|nr:hypothetical protein B0T13DRAFT_121341 [Neurospora crassa]
MVRFHFMVVDPRICWHVHKVRTSSVSFQSFVAKEVGHLPRLHAENCDKRNSCPIDVFDFIESLEVASVFFLRSNFNHSILQSKQSLSLLVESRCYRGWSGHACQPSSDPRVLEQSTQTPVRGGQCSLPFHRHTQSHSIPNPASKNMSLVSRNILLEFLFPLHTGAVVYIIGSFSCQTRHWLTVVRPNGQKSDGHIDRIAIPSSRGYLRRFRVDVPLRLATLPQLSPAILSLPLASDSGGLGGVDG